MSIKASKRVLLQHLTIITILTAIAFVIWPNESVYAVKLAAPTLPKTTETDEGAEGDISMVYIPVLLSDYPWISPFGIESNAPLLPTNGMLTWATDLNIGYARMGTRISWRSMQPAPWLPPNFGSLATFEEELRGLNQAGVTPLVTILDTPYWALKQNARDDEQLTSCGPIAEEYFDEFASFVKELVNRYKAPEFNVHNWEIGNEPDVDPNEVPLDYGFGCWGDIDDTVYFGGYYYGQMLRVVSAAIKQADPTAQVWVGGLLLDRPVTDPDDADEKGYTEKFFVGILEEIRDSGAGTSFDIVPYHAYSTYWDNYGNGKSYDYDILPGYVWYAWGGTVVGKARFLRQFMAEYGVNKPVFLDETGFGCPEGNSYCLAPGPSFFESQATHLVRYFTRGLSEQVPGLMWYTLNGPGWRYSSLLDENQQPRLSYGAYQVFSNQLQHAHYLYQVDYATGIEAYAFRRNSEQVHIIWAKEDETIPFYVPVNRFIMALSREGAVLYDSTNPPPEFGTEFMLEARFEPIYIIIRP